MSLAYGVIRRLSLLRAVSLRYVSTAQATVSADVAAEGDEHTLTDGPVLSCSSCKTPHTLVQVLSQCDVAHGEPHYWLRFRCPSGAAEKEASAQKPRCDIQYLQIRPLVFGGAGAEADSDAVDSDASHDDAGFGTQPQEAATVLLGTLGYGAAVDMGKVMLSADALFEEMRHAKSDEELRAKERALESALGAAALEYARAHSVRELLRETADASVDAPFLYPGGVPPFVGSDGALLLDADAIEQRWRQLHVDHSHIVHGLTTHFSEPSDDYEYTSVSRGRVGALAAALAYRPQYMQVRFWDRVWSLPVHPFAPGSLWKSIHERVYEDVE